MDSSSRGHSGKTTGRGDGLDSASAAAASLQVLLKEDPLLKQFGLTEASRSGDQVAFAYASTLLQKEGERGDTQQQADLALQDVDRKLILVQSLAVKLSRTSPEAVAGHFLELHGYNLEEHQAEAELSTITLRAMREKADRLQKQAESLETVTRRVESSLARGLTRMEVSCKNLERVLLLSASLKKILRMQFENEKLQSYDLDDLRDLTRAAASVAVLEDLLKETSDEKIDIVEKLRPEAESTARAVRKAAASLMAQHQNTAKMNALQKLGATLQVYYHLGELPDAVWKAVDDAHTKAEAACRELWNPVTLSGIQEQAKKAAKGDTKSLAKKLTEARTQVVQEWSNHMVEAALQVFHLQTVLLRKTDPVSRSVFLDVVAAGPIPAEYSVHSQEKFSLFTLYWSRLSRSLAEIIANALQYDKGKMKAEISSLYPAVRSASIELLARIQDSKGASSSSATGIEDSSAGTSGILGGSFALDDELLTQGKAMASLPDNPQAAVSADTWTRPLNSESPGESNFTALTGASLSAVFNSIEWEEFRGNKETGSGIFRLEQVFLEKCKDRLHEPLQYMFPEHIAVDDDGVAIAGAVTTVLLPSKYDLQRFEQNIRQELSLADPKEGGGDFSTVTMIADCVVDLIVEFCTRAKNAISGVGENGYLAANTFAMTENLQHDRKVAAIMFTLANYLREAPHKTFVGPYLPATLSQHEEAAKICQRALAPAIDSINRMVKSTILNPLCRALNRQIASVLAKIHMGVYLESSSDKDGEGQPSFVQKHLSTIFDSIAKNFLVKFPPPYSSTVASTVSTFTIYTYISNVCLVRPLEETARLHITQDLADLELVLEQFLGKISGGASKPLSQIEKGKPYAELRGVRQMLFWTGLESKNTSSTELAKALLREPWMRDIRPSTIFHYLFSFAPTLLSSPHHVKRVKAEEYVSSMLVQLDGSVEAGEDDAWMVTVGCCDDYQQRASAGAIGDGDVRVAQLVITLGQELNRQRRH
ncbi:hypothetical protein FisN_36Hh028 [Fistulifera solaris]|uniref:Conserved oligomeric Golgi complex subunit 5 helical domain-containing protein n=1 Tax=Fistulifera solaris TaxID=1519565 RepID=A0A1Z5KT73_FISSO|nr:hypothetical protein FisN_36Hh028 [Fistulifera solaris]|eukprot:GAX29534.1 hypothetical protein FisN_36Hh028 [Fistulifera solaris]